MSHRNVRRILLSVMVVVFGLSAISTAFQTYSPQNLLINCECKTITVYQLTSADFDQSTAAQNAAWSSFKDTFTGITDSNRIDNETKTYNCHSYAFNSSDRWLNSPSPFFGTTWGCWMESANGSVKSSSVHSCLVSGNTGKCGQLFLCRNNQYVYNDMPTTRYIYVPY